MSLFSIFQISKSNYLSGLLALLPISFIAGNMMINFNVVLLILISLFFFKKNIFKIEYYFLDKVILVFFIFILVNGIYGDFKLYINHNEFYLSRAFATSLKSVFFLRFLLLYIALRFLIEKEKIS